MADLTGRTAIVTGASRGIGRAVAERLVAEGARVVVTGRTRETLDELVGRLGRGAAVAVAGTTVTLQPARARSRRMLRFTP